MKRVIKCATSPVRDVEDYVSDMARGDKMCGMPCEDYREFAKILESDGYAASEGLYDFYLECIIDEADEVMFSTEITASSSDGLKFQPGMYWTQDWHTFTVKARSGNNMTVEETWIAEDSGKECRDLMRYNITEDASGSEFGCPVGYEDVPGCGIHVSNVYNLDEFTDAEPEYDDYNYSEEDDYYTPSSTHGDYSPSNPWDAPGMSIHDFI